MNMVEKLAKQFAENKKIKEYAESESIRMMEDYINRNSRLVGLMDYYELVDQLKLTVYPILLHLGLPNNRNNESSIEVASIVANNAIKIAGKIKG